MTCRRCSLDAHSQCRDPECPCTFPLHIGRPDVTCPAPPKPLGPSEMASPLPPAPPPPSVPAIPERTAGAGLGERDERLTGRPPVLAAAPVTVAPVEPVEVVVVARTLRTRRNVHRLALVRLVSEMTALAGRDGDVVGAMVCRFLDDNGWSPQALSLAAAVLAAEMSPSAA